MTKVCIRQTCFFSGLLQTEDCFSKNKRNKDGLCSECKVCDKQHYEEHKEEIKQYSREYRRDHREKRKRYDKQYSEDHKEERNERLKKRRQENIDFKIIGNIRNRLYDAIKHNYKSGSAVADLGMTISDFKKWLEEKFYANPITGEMMTWEN